MEEKEPQKQVNEEEEAKLPGIAAAILEADALLVLTGAGMGVGSGLGTFRGPNAGVWPPLKKLGLDFTDMSNPKWFSKDPHFGWSFWHFRYHAYTGAEPHKGYHLLKEWAAEKKCGGFSFTSNIDGHWIACGWPEDRVQECHGTLRYLQCSKLCTEEYWPTPPEQIDFEIDPTTDKAKDPLPKCKNCDAVARPNVLMFGDFGWVADRCEIQMENYSLWLSDVLTNATKVVLIEIGAGKAVPTVRHETHSRANAWANAGFEGTIKVVRINPVESDSKMDRPLAEGVEGISLTMNGEEALLKVAALIEKMKAEQKK